MKLNILYITFLLTIFTVSCKYGDDDHKLNNNIEVNNIEIKNEELYRVYKNKYKDKEVLTFLEGDFSGDDILDLVMIYKESDFENKLIGIYKNNKDEILITNPIPAPIEHYLLNFYDIDKKTPQEILVSGQKGVNIGFAVYRLENGEFISLFENGMEKCC